MANMIMASSTKTPITSPTKILPTLSHSNSNSNSISISPKPKFNLPKFLKFPSLKFNSLAAAIATTTLATAPPSLAEEFEKAQLFDFDLTLPIMMVQFLALMVALDKIYYSRLGNFMDERDAKIKAMLADVGDTTAEVKQLEEQAAAVMRAAKAEVAAALNAMKKETTKEVEEKIAEGKAKLEAELLAALDALEKQKEETKKSLDSQIAALSDEIVKKVLPA